MDLLVAQGTLKSLLQYHSSKASILQCSAFFIVQLSHLYMTTGKTIALTRWIFVGKVMSLLFNMLSRLVITFLPRSKCLLISWLQSPSAVILEPKKTKSATVSTASSPICHDGTGCHDLSFLSLSQLFHSLLLHMMVPSCGTKVSVIFIGTKGTGMTIALIHSNFGIEGSENEGIIFSPIQVHVLPEFGPWDSGVHRPRLATPAKTVSTVTGLSYTRNQS